MHIAAEKGYFDICKLLCEYYNAEIDITNVSKKACTPLHQATKHLRVEPIKVLVKNNANYMLKDVDGKTCLDYAKDMENDELIQLLQQVEQIPRIVGIYPTELGLINATMQNHDVAVEILIFAPGIDVNTVDNDGRTALMHASEKGFSDITSILCNNKADVNFKEKWDGNTALHYAYV